MKFLPKFLKLNPELEPLLAKLGSRGSTLERSAGREFDIVNNGKLGKDFKDLNFTDSDKLAAHDIKAFSQPPHITCPGSCKNGICSKCFGDHGQFQAIGNKSAAGTYTTDKQMRNFESSQKPWFVEEFIKDLMRKKNQPRFMRFHDVGDIYSQEYANKMRDIAQGMPYQDFYAYTKSLGFDLNDIKDLPNFGLIQSMGTRFTDKIDPKLPIAIPMPKGMDKLPEGWVDARTFDQPAAMAALSKGPQRIALETKWIPKEDKLWQRIQDDFDFVREGDKLTGWNPKDARDMIRESNDVRSLHKNFEIQDILDQVDPDSPLAMFLRKHYG